MYVHYVKMYQVFVGKMYPCIKQEKGSHDSSSRMQRILVKKNCTFKRKLVEVKPHLYRRIHILQFLGVVFNETSLTILSNLVDGKNLHTLIFDPKSPTVRYLLLQIMKLVCE